MNQANTKSRAMGWIIGLMLIVAFGSQVRYTARKIEFQNMQVLAGELRGADGQAVAAVYGAAEIKGFYDRIQQGTMAAYAAAQPRRLLAWGAPAPIQVQTKFQELKLGVLTVTITAAGDTAPNASKAWEKVFDNPQTFAGDLDAFSRTVGTEMAGF